MKEINFSDKAKSIKLGIYQHYKGNKYQVIAVAHDSDDLGEMVIYRALYGKHNLWVKKIDIWLKPEVVNGQKISRFKYLKSDV